MIFIMGETVSIFHLLYFLNVEKREVMQIMYDKDHLNLSLV